MRSIFLLLLFLTFPIGSLAYIEQGKEKTDIKVVVPVVIHSDGITNNLVYAANRERDNYIINACHKDYTNNYVLRSELTRTQYKNIPVVQETGRPYINQTTISFDAVCTSLTVNGTKGEKVKIGLQSTIIEFQESDITFGVDQVGSCDHRKCTSSIYIINKQNTSVLFNLSSLNVSIYGHEESYFEYDHTFNFSETRPLFDPKASQPGGATLGYFLFSEIVTYRERIGKNTLVEIPASTQQEIYYTVVLSEAKTAYKYDVAISYQGIYFIIDPFFFTNGSNFSTGTFNFTRNQASYVELNNSLAGNYQSQIFDAGSNQIWNNITVDITPFNELPSNIYNESKNFTDGIDMREIRTLLHFNNDTSVGETATTAYDYSGRGNNGTFTNGAFHNCTGNIMGCSAEFDGSNDVVIVNGTNLGFFVSQYAFSFWMYPHVASDSGAYSQVIDKSGSAGANPQFDFDWRHVDSTFARACYHKSGGTHKKAKLTTNPAINQWHHIVCTYDGTNIRAYYNGVLETTTAAGLPNAGTGPLTIGMGNEMGSLEYAFDGKVDEVAVFNRSLSATEIENIFKRGIAKYNISVRSCDDALCSGETYTNLVTHPLNPFYNITVSNNQYFQYKIDFSSTNTSKSSFLYKMNVSYSAVPIVPLFNFTVESFGQEWIKVNWT